MTVMPPDALISQLQWRYAVKKFDPTKKIPEPLWQSLEEALHLSPSSYGLQPWKFTVITDPAKRAELQKVSWNQPQIVEASHLVAFAARKTVTAADVERLIQQTLKVRGGNPADLEGYKQMMVGSVSRGKPEALAAWAAHQAYIALGVFLTSAAVIGVDACPMEGISGADYDKILGLESQGFATLCVATAGYRAADDKYALAPKVRFDAKDVITHL